ncbi:MAG: hypothetical protein WCZ19_02555 [Acholeplasma sp.]
MIVKELLKIKFSAKRRYAIFIFIAALVVLGYTIFDVMAHTNDQGMEVFNWIIIGVSSLLALFGLYIAIGASLDIKMLKSDKLPVINAQFIKFSKRGFSTKDRNEVVYTGQVFLDLEDNSEKLLIVSNVELNKKYRIMYGRHTNIGVIIQRN